MPVNIIIRRKISLDGPLNTEHLLGNLYVGEKKAHTFIIEAYQDGEKVTLSGSVTARFIRVANNTTVLCAGTIDEEGRAVLTLEDDCYNIDTRYAMVIFVTSSGTTTAIYSAAGDLRRTVQGDMIDSGDIVPDISDLIAAIEDAQRAATAASNAAEAATAAAEQATAATEPTTIGAVAFSKAQTLTDAQKEQARDNIGAADDADVQAAMANLNPEGIGAVAYGKAQTLTDEQKSQARTNIGAVSSDDVDQAIDAMTPEDLGAVAYNKKQLMSEAQQAQARGNIGAASDEDVQTALRALTPEGIGAVAYFKAQELTDAQKEQARDNIGAANDAAVQALNTKTSNPTYMGAVSFRNAQNLSEAEQQVARDNIGLRDIGSMVEGTVKYNESQTLTDEQKAIARGNIGAESEQHATEMSGRLSTAESTLSGMRTELDAIGNAVADVSQNANGLHITYIDETTKDIELDQGSELHLYYDSENYLHLLDDDDVEQGDPVYIAGGSGTGTGGSASLRRVTDAAVDIIYGDTSPIQYIFEAVDSTGDVTGNGTGTWTVNGTTVASNLDIPQGAGSFDIGPYLQSGTNTVRLTVKVRISDELTLSASKTWTINAVYLRFTWAYDDAQINTSAFVDRWTPYGEVAKTTHTVLDGNELDPSTTERSGVQQSMTIPMQTHGAHSIERWLTATVNGQTIPTEQEYHEAIFVVAGNNTPIIAISMKNTTTSQYNTLRIPVTIYDPAQLTVNATITVDGEPLASWADVDRTVHYLTYTPTEPGAHVLTVTCGSVSKSITVTATEVSIDAAEIEGWALRFKASELATNDAVRAWTSEGVNATFSENFDWINGGLKTETTADDLVQQFLRIKAGTRMTINKQIFTTDPRAAGFCYKMIFKVTSCRNYDAEIAHCYADGAGIRMYAHRADFSSAAVDVSVQYGEDEMIELEYDIYPAPRVEGDGNHRYMMAWMDGVPTSCRLYGETDSFIHTAANAENIIIGSDDCDVDVYMVKVYQRLITRDEHVANFITDAPTAKAMLERYDRNDILDESGEIDYEKLAAKNPNCRVWLYDIPYLSNGKKDKVKNCGFRQIWRGGDTYYQIEGTGTMTIQGTSSVDYIHGAANTDIDFKTLRDGDGNDLLENGVVDEDHYGKNYFVGENDQVTVFEVTAGQKLGPECVPVERDASGNVTKYIKALGYKINDDSTPISYSNMKVNFASCEQANNMCNAAWYQRFNPFPSKTPRDCMEFAMGVQFIRDAGQLPDDKHFTVFENDGKFHCYSIGNLGTSKKNVHVFHDMANANEACIEVNNNEGDQCRMISSDLTQEDFSGDYFFGMRYPDTKSPAQAIKDGWTRFVEWMADRNPSAYTGEELDPPETYGEYTFVGHNRAGTQVLKGTKVTQYAGTYTHDTFERRMARMLSECEDYMAMDSVIYHYVYIERHTMVDNVAKNTFWSSDDLQHWDLSKAYDMDTSDGNNNDGEMVFDYGNEATDTVGTKTVFNAADAVWFVFASNLYEACQTMFTNREAAGAWSAAAYHAFLLSEQQKVPERVWIQCYWYDYLRTYEEGITQKWMAFLDGGQKTHQRAHYETFEEAYDSAKYRGSACLSQNATFRGYTPDNWTGVQPKNEITLKMYNKMYIVVKVGETFTPMLKAEKGTTYTINFDSSGKLNDTVINIYTAQMVQEIGSLAPLYPGSLQFGKASKLRTLEVGSSVEGYRNTNFNGLSLTNNAMLENLYVQNLVNGEKTIVGVLALGACPALKYLDARGSDFTEVTFADGGLVSEAHLEAPVALGLRNLLYLTDAKFTVADYTKLITLRLENCPGITSLDIVRAATALIVARILGIDWSMSTTADLDRLYAMTGLDESGLSTPRAVLTGDAYVSYMRQRNLEQYNEAWPNLNVTYGQLVAQYAVSFVNADGTPIRSKATGEAYVQYVDRGSAPIDPVTAGYVNQPAMDPDAQYVYTYAGWDDLESTVLADKTITATYTTQTRTYVVNWYADVDDLRKTGTYEYGTEAVFSETGELPTLTSQESEHMFNCFLGWDKSTGFIKENLNVFARWSTATEPAAGTDLSVMTPGQIMAIRQTDAAASYLSDKDHIDFVVGRDWDFDNVEAETLLEETYFDGSTAIDKQVRLFSEDAGNWTMAIDFEFTGSTANATLASLGYIYTGNEGLRLRYSSGPNLQWGDRAIPVGNTFRRGIVVIRHRAGSQNIFVYAHNTSTDVYNDEMIVAELARNRATETDQVITFGAVKMSDGYDYYGTGWIHWAKVWHEDLGAADCRAMGNWPRETWRAEYYGAKIYRLENGSSQKAPASFVLNNMLSHGHRHRSSNTNVGGYPTSEIRTILNERVYAALPEWLQAMIRTVTVYSSEGDKSTGIVASNDKLYLLSYSELSGSTGDPYASESDGRVSWFTNDRTRVKFRGQIIKEDAQYIVEATDPTMLSSYTVKEGDIWINTSNSSIGYMYFSAATVAKHMYLGTSKTSSDNIAANDGGLWVRASNWWERSPHAGFSTYFMNVYISGYPGNNYSATGTIGLVPGFSI